MYRFASHSPGFFGRLTELILEIFPFILVVLASVVELATAPFFESLGGVPRLPLLMVCFWSLFRPQGMPAASLFVLGIFHDSLHGLPTGLTSLILIVVSQVLFYQRRSILAQTWIIELLVLLVLIILAVFVQSLLMWSLFDQPLIFADDVWVIVFTVAIYPLFLVMFSTAGRRSRIAGLNSYD